GTVRDDAGRSRRAARCAHLGAARGERARGDSLRHGLHLSRGLAHDPRREAASPRGAFVDSVVDRWAEFATFLGLGLFFRRSWVCLAVVGAAFASLMVSYTRARAEGLGIALTVG